MATNNSLNYYPQPRYNNRSLGISYVGAYDPAVDQQMLGMMQREYGKAFSANQALAEEQARQGEIYSRDIAGREQRMGEFKNTIGGIKEHYNNDLALAAPELARAVAKERQNPWYQKNKLYTEEYQRRQKLLDQFGPNIIFTKDLPQGNLNDMEMDELGFEYLNRIHLDQRNKEMFGALGDKITDLGVVQDPQDSRFIREGKRKGLTQTEINQLVEEQGPEYINQMIDNMGISDTPANRAMLLSEFSTWANSNLVGGETYNRMIDPAYTQSLKDAGNGSVPYTPNPQFNPTDETPTVDKSSDPAETAGRVIAKAQADPNSREGVYMENRIREIDDPTRRGHLMNTWNTLKNAFSTLEIPGASQEQLSALKTNLVSRISDDGNKNANKNILEAMVDSGIVRQNTSVVPNPVGGSPITRTVYNYEGTQWEASDLHKFFDTMGIRETYKTLNQTKQSDLEALGDLYDPTAVTTRTYNPETPEIGANAQGFIRSNVVGVRDFDEVHNLGMKVYKSGSSKPAKDKKTEDIFNSWKNASPEELKRHNISVVPGSIAGPPKMQIRTPKDDLIELPLQRDAAPLLQQSTSGNVLQLMAGMFDTPQLVDSEINYVAGSMMRKSGKKDLPVSELFGGVAQGQNLGVLKQEGPNHYTWTIPGREPGPETTAIGRTPSEALQNIGTVVGPQLGSKFTKIDEYIQHMANKYATGTNYRDTFTSLAGQYQ